MSLAMLGALEAGSPYVFAGDAAAIRHQVDELSAPVNGRAFLVTAVGTGIRASALSGHLLRELARTALGLWPDWYGTTIETSTETTALASSALEKSASQAARARRGVNLAWLRQAAHMAHHSVAPVVPGLPRVAQIAQLATAIAPGGLVLMLEGAWEKLEDADSISRQLENVSVVTSLTVVLLSDSHPIPHAFSRFSRIGQREPAKSAPQAETPSPLFGPVVGRPHPNSPAERLLYQRLSAAEDLRPLFGWNQVLHLSPAATPKVDLAWLEGKLVVEIDGWADHSTREKFESDRQRDYELIAHGYTVLRVSNSEVLSDTERVVSKIRRLVEMRSTEHSEGT